MNKRQVILFGMLLSLLAMVAASFMLGRYTISPEIVLKISLSKIFPIQIAWESRMETVFWNVRFPRVAMAVMVGASLSGAGAAYQCIFQNPMAAPDVLGASSGAALGAVAGILLGLGNIGITACAFALSLLSVLLVMLLGARVRGNKVTGLILSGIMLSSLLSAGISFVKLVADPNEQLPAITYWLMGSLSGSKSSEMLIGIPMASGLIMLMLMRQHLNIMTLGDDEAATLGISPRITRITIVTAATLCTAAAVAFSGMIGFVGLVVPHLCRKVIGANYRYLMPASIIMGGVFLLAADNIARTLLNSEIPIGIITAFVGAPFFIYLLLRGE